MNSNESKEIEAEFKIREVEKKDMKDICDFHSRCRKENFKWIIDQDYLKDVWRKPAWWWKHILEKKSEWNYVMFVYEKWWKIVWFIDGWPSYDESYDFKIPWFYINPDNQREWIWRKLWDYLLNSKNFKDKKSFYLRTLKDNIIWSSFYEKMWWKLINEKKDKFWDKEYDLVCYAWKR